MKCTDCSNELLPVVAVDIDGTLANYYDHFHMFATRYWDRALHTNWDGTGNWEDHLGLTQEEYRQAKLAYRQGGMKRTLPIYPDAGVFMGWLQTQQVEVWVATTRPWQRLDNIDPDTQWWLARHGFDVKGLIYGEDKYVQLAQVVDTRRIIGVIDDLIENLAAAYDLSMPTFQVARAHNRHATTKWQHRGNLGDAATWVTHNRKMWEEEAR